MQLSNLLSVQETELENSLIEIYEEDRGFFWGDKPYLDLSSSRIKEVFEELSPEVRELYLRSLKEDYVLNKQEFEERFSENGEELINRGFYLWSEKQAHFIPPSEFVEGLLPDSLITTLLQCTRAQLLKLWRGKLNSTPKHAVIKKTLHDANSRYNVEHLDNKELDRIAALLQPYRMLTEEDSGTQHDYLGDKWLEISVTLKLELGEQKHWAPHRSADEYMAALEKRIKNLLEEKLLFIKGNSHNPTISINPLIRDALDKRVVESARAQFEKGLDSLKPLPNTTAALLQYRESFHIEPNNLLRVSSFLASWVDSRRVRITGDNLPRVSDIKKLAKTLAADKEEVGFYIKLLEYLFKRYTSKDAFREAPSLSRREDIWNALVEVSEQRLLNVLTNPEDKPFLKNFLALLDRLPKGEWLKVDDIESLFDLFYSAEGGELRIRHKIQYSLPYLFFLAQALGRADVLTSTEKTVNKEAAVYALRLVPSVEEDFFDNGAAPLVIQGNLEIPIPFGISQSKLFVAARLFDLQDINTLKLTRDVVVRIANSGLSTQKALNSIEKLLTNDLPEAAQKLFSRVFEERIRVFFDGSCLYLYDPAAFEEIKSLIPADRILRTIDKRLFILSSYGQDAVLISRLEKNNVTIERGGLPR